LKLRPLFVVCVQRPICDLPSVGPPDRTDGKRDKREGESANEVVLAPEGWLDAAAEKWESVIPGGSGGCEVCS